MHTAPGQEHHENPKTSYKSNNFGYDNKFVPVPLNLLKQPLLGT